MGRRIGISIFLFFSMLFLSACTLDDVNDFLQAAEEIQTAIENENQKEPDNQSEKPISKSGSLLKSKGTIDPIPAELVRPVDGDTAVFAFDTDGDGKVEEHSARFLLIDTPETRHPRLGKQPLGEEAKKRTAELLKSGDITIEFDVGRRLDKYARILVYVYVDGESVQEKLLEEGLARVAYVYPPNTRYVDDFEEKQRTAQNKKTGIWSMEGYVTDSGFNTNEGGQK